jgi:hypothetical protein
MTVDEFLERVPVTGVSYALAEEITGLPEKRARRLVNRLLSAGRLVYLREAAGLVYWQVDRVDPCFAQERGKTVTGTCVICGTTFEALALWRKKYCSERCHRTSRNVTRARVPTTAALVPGVFP